MKVKVYEFRGIRENERDENWGDYIDYEDRPSKVYERYARAGEEIPQYKVHEEMVSDDGIHQKWVKTIVVCCK